MKRDERCRSCSTPLSRHRRAKSRYSAKGVKGNGRYTWRVACHRVSLYRKQVRGSIWKVSRPACRRWTWQATTAHRASTGVDLGPFFRTLGKVWSRPGEALGEVSLPETLTGHGLDVHPLVLDGCFQVVGAARNLEGTGSETTYLPFGWERLWLTGRLPDRIICHVRLSEASQGLETDEPPEVLSGELNIYDLNGVPLGGLSGYTVKRATQEALLSAVEGVKDLLYEVVWRDRDLSPGITPADFFQIRQLSRKVRSRSLVI